MAGHGREPIFGGGVVKKTNHRDYDWVRALLAVKHECGLEANECQLFRSSMHEDCDRRSFSMPRQNRQL